jgi:hypothetical protein
MIWESCYWKADILKSSQWLKTKVIYRRSPSNKIQIELEKCLMITAYQIRKLIEAHKVSNAVAEMKLPVIEYFKNIKNVTFMNWHRLNELYDLEQNREIEIKIIKLCNLIIHSYIFIPHLSSNTGPFIGMFISSDKTRNKCLYYLELKKWIEYLDFISNDYPNSCSMVFDKKTNDYIVYSETKKRNRRK